MMPRDMTHFTTFPASGSSLRRIILQTPHAPMNSQYMCHCCARCFGTADELLGHIQCQQSLLLRQVQELCEMPQPSVVNVLQVLLQCVTHATDTDWKQNLGCPELGCNYAATDEHQALQRHYLQHISCDFTCPFCSKHISSVSIVARHPVTCKSRRGRSIPREIEKKKAKLVQDAHAKLRLAQNSKRFLRRNSSAKTSMHRQPPPGSYNRNSYSTTNFPFSTTHTSYNTALDNGMRGGQTRSLPQSYSTTATSSLPSSGNIGIHSTASDHFPEIGSTRMHVMGNSACDVFPRTSPQEPISASIPSGAQTYQPSVTPDSIDTQRASSLIYTADGATNHAAEQYFGAAGAFPPDQTSPYTEREQWPALGLDVGTHYTGSSPTVLGQTYNPGDFSTNGGVNRALGLIYTADGCYNLET